MPDPFNVSSGGGHGRSAPVRSGDFFRDALAKTSPGRSPSGPAALKPVGQVGLLGAGNIDLAARPIVHNKNGSYSTVRSITITDEDGRATLIPTVVGNRVVSNEQAIKHYQRTGQHLGQFDSETDADAYAQRLHEAQAKQYAPRASVPPSLAPRTAGRGHRMVVGLQPSGQSPVSDAVHALLHGTGGASAPIDPKTGQPLKVSSPSLFTPATLGLEQLLHLPSLVSGAHETAVALAHPKPGGPSGVDALLSGALGVPFGRTSGEGPHPRMIPKVAKGTATEATGGELGRDVRKRLAGRVPVVDETGQPVVHAKGAEQGMPRYEKPEDALSARQARIEQDKLYSAERSKRSGAAAQAMEIGGRAGYEAALSQLKGELPKLQFGGFENFDQAGLDALFTHVQNHPALRPYEKLRTQTALLSVLDGKVPTRSELALLGQVFGKEVSGRIAASVPLIAKAKNLGLELWNVPRSLMSSFDVSAPFRQGLVSGVAHPRLFARNFGPMFQAFGSENAYRSIMDDIATRPTFPKMQKSGLALTDLGPLEQREEQFVSNLAEKIPVVGRGVRASGRAYTGFLTKMRADVFDSLVDSAGQQGLDVNDERLLSSIARYVNSATGRGDLGALQKHAVTLNSVFFSPRLLASRVNFLNPVYYAKLDPFARMQALKAARNLVGTVGTVLVLAKLAGAEVNTDPRNADFAKMKFGDTRIDVLGGFQQPIRLLAQLFSGKIVSSTTGKTLTLGPQGPGVLSRKDIAQRFLEQKLAPSPSLINDWFKGTDFSDKPFSWKRAATQRMIPLLVQDAAQLYQQDGLLPALGGYGLGAFGFGIQTYGTQQPKKSRGSAPGDPFNVSGGGAGSSDPFGVNP